MLTSGEIAVAHHFLTRLDHADEHGFLVKEAAFVAVFVNRGHAEIVSPVVFQVRQLQERFPACGGHVRRIRTEAGVDIVRIDIGITELVEHQGHVVDPGLDEQRRPLCRTLPWKLEGALSFIAAGKIHLISHCAVRPYLFRLGHILDRPVDQGIAVRRALCCIENPFSGSSTNSN